jgi:MoxR-like ATPase
LVLAGKILALADGRYNVAFEDIRRAVVPALRHRVILNFEGEAEGIETGDLVAKVAQELPEAPSEIRAAVVS